MSELKKFRAWDGLNKKMSFWTMNDLCTWNEKSEKPSPFDEWMQFTGLKDKNEVEIYEGDICKYSRYANWENFNGKDSRMIGEVKFGGGHFEGSFYLNLISKGEYESSISYPVSNILLSETNPTWGLEVIGNIYQDKHLLDK